MNSTRNPFLSQQDLTSPRSAEARKAVFKILSETLRPPPKQEQRKSISKQNLQKVNKKSPRPGFTPSNSSNYSPYAPNKPIKVTQKYNSTSKLKPKKGAAGGIGGGEGEAAIRKATSLDPTSSSPHSKHSSKEIPQTIKDCHLNNVLRSARRCMFELREAKECLTCIVSQDEELSRGIKIVNPTEAQRQLADVGLSITNLCREAFIPAHRLNQTAIALYAAEDFLRYPSDLRSFDLRAKRGRVNLPDMTFNVATVIKLRQVVDLTAVTYNKFEGKGRLGEQLQEILFSILRGYQDFYAATLGCQEIFKVLLYAGQKDKIHLQQFLLALSPMERSDLLVEIQDLRRILDEIVIFLEKFSWGSFVVYRLASGGENNNNNSSGRAQSVYQSPSGDCCDPNHDVKSTSSIPAYPAYPLLRATVPNLKSYPVEEDESNVSRKDSYQFQPVKDETPSFARAVSSIAAAVKDEQKGVNLNAKRGGGGKAKSKLSILQGKSTSSINRY